MHFLRGLQIDAELIAPGVPMPTVPLAAAAAPKSCYSGSDRTISSG
jgi:hypothetical protein